MIQATQAAFLVAAEDERCAAMRAVLVQHAQAAGGVAEGHELFTEQPHAHRRAVALRDFFREASGNPVAAHQAAHRRIALDPAEEVVVLGSEHGSSVAALRAPAYY